ncbi:hypothetical protein Q6251_32075, partial [Klebsiella quasipneumoniae]
FLLTQTIGYVKTIQVFDQSQKGFWRVLEVRESVPAAAAGKFASAGLGIEPARPGDWKSCALRGGELQGEKAQS